VYLQPAEFCFPAGDGWRKIRSGQPQESGLSVEAFAELVLRREALRGLRESSTATPNDPPIWNVITDIVRDVPDKIFDRLPKDGASQIDHYVYGLAKRDY
jgi:hypothetical protein